MHLEYTWKCVICEKANQEGKELKDQFAIGMSIADTTGKLVFEGAYTRLARSFRDHLIKVHPDSVPNREAVLLAALRNQEKVKDELDKTKQAKRRRVEKRAEHAYDMSAALRPFHHREPRHADTDDDL